MEASALFADAMMRQHIDLFIAAPRALPPGSISGQPYLLARSSRLF